jgi:hypothetical protein
MVTVLAKSGRRFEVRSTQYGTTNLVHHLFYGGIFLAGTDRRGDAGESSSTMELTIERADKRADQLGICVED